MNDTLIDFTIGTDPEFACVDKNNEIICADEVFGNDEDTEDEGEAGIELGADGNGTTFEIRPSPSKCPLKVIQNIHDIFVRQVIEKPEFMGYKWIAGSWHGGYPLGGHVHFGINGRQMNHADAVNILDHYVGVVSLLMEIKAHGLSRRQDGYGVMGDMRDQPWGFEYRPMSSWLGSPYIAAAIMCLSKTVMYELLNNKKFEWHKFAQPDDFSKMDTTRVLAQFPNIWSDIVKMHLYQKYKPYIDIIYFIIKNNLTWTPAKGMKESWGVVDMLPCITSKIGMDILWYRFNIEA